MTRRVLPFVFRCRDEGFTISNHPNNKNRKKRIIAPPYIYIAMVIVPTYPYYIKPLRYLPKYNVTFRELRVHNDLCNIQILLCLVGQEYYRYSVGTRRSLRIRFIFKSKLLNKINMQYYVLMIFDYINICMLSITLT